jgi:hypothetical protein
MNQYRRNKKRGNNRRAYNQTPDFAYTNVESFARTFLEPRKMIVFRYMQTFQFSLTAGTGTQQRMRLNSLNDPDIDNATGAHQPYGHDQLVALYARYRVLKTRVIGVFSPSSLSYGVVVIPCNAALGVTISDQATFQTASESPRAIHWMQGASGVSRRLVKNISLNDLNGTSVAEYCASDRTQAQVAANPTENLELVIGLFNPGAATIIVNFELDMRFFTEIWDPILLAGS